MDWGKIDAALAAALEDVGAQDVAAGDAGARDAGARDQEGLVRGRRKEATRLSVFVHLDPEASPRDKEALADFGLPKTVLRRRSTIATATLTPDDIASLSEQSCVRQLRLSTPLRLLQDGQ